MEDLSPDLAPWEGLVSFDWPESAAGEAIPAGLQLMVGERGTIEPWRSFRMKENVRIPRVALVAGEELHRGDLVRITARGLVYKRETP